MKIQQKKLEKFLKNHGKNSQFYKSFIDNNTGLRGFPIISKKEWMENFNTINTVGLDREQAFSLAKESEISREFKSELKDITIGLSSGTSGMGGIFIASKNERYRWAGYILAKFIPEILFKFKAYKIAFFLRANSNLYETVNSKKIDFKFFDMIKPMEENIKELTEFSPDILIAPPSMIKEIAKYKEKENLDRLNPQKIISVAEVLDEIDKEYFKKAFNKDIIHEVYQCTEGLLGLTCKYGNIHLSEENIIFEKEEIGENKFIPIITDFTRVSQPIIRYRHNDILVSDMKTCKCGDPSMVIDKILGREDDIFKFEAVEGDKHINVFPDFLTRAVIYSSEKIIDYKIEQITLNEINIYIKCKQEDENNISISLKEEFSNMLSNFNIKMPLINIIFKLPIKENKKLKRVERKFDKVTTEQGQKAFN